MMRPWFATAPSPETLTQPFYCKCSCHPVLTKPKAEIEGRCRTCYEDMGKPWAEVLESALAEVEKVQP